MAVFAPLFVRRVASFSLRVEAPCVWVASFISKHGECLAATSRFFGLQVRVGSEVAMAVFAPLFVCRVASSSSEAPCASRSSTMSTYSRAKIFSVSLRGRDGRPGISVGSVAFGDMIGRACGGGASGPNQAAAEAKSSSREAEPLVMVGIKESPA